MSQSRLSLGPSPRDLGTGHFPAPCSRGWLPRLLGRKGACVGVYMEEMGLSLTNPTLAQVRTLSRLRDELRMKREIEDLTPVDEERLAVLDRIHQQLLQHAQHMEQQSHSCLLYTSPSPRDRSVSRMPSSA